MDENWKDNNTLLVEAARHQLYYGVVMHRRRGDAYIYIYNVSMRGE